MKEFESNYDEKIVKAVAHEIDFYMASDRYNQLYREQLN
jgi:hypothetical protein